MTTDPAGVRAAHRERRPLVVTGVLCLFLSGAAAWLISLVYAAQAGSRLLDLGEFRRSQELTGYAMAALICLGLGGTQAIGRHAVIDLVSAQLPARVRAVHRRVCDLLGMVVGGLLAYSGWVLAMQSREFGVVSTSSWEVPLYLPQLLIFVGGALLAWEHLIDLLGIRPPLPRLLVEDFTGTATSPSSGSGETS